jgi:hypothetical protein
LIALREDRHLAQPVALEQQLAAASIVQHIDDDEINSVFRKKLFRSEATASPGLGEVNVSVRRDVHGVPFVTR